MRFKILFLQLLTTTFAFSQYNYVENGDFEYFNSTWDLCGHGGPHGASEQQNLENYWSRAWPWSPPKHTGVYIDNSCGSADLHCEDGIKGPHFAYTGPKEYIVAPLKKNLEIDKYYYVEFYFMGSPSNSAGLKFFNSKPKQKNLRMLLMTMAL